MAESTEKALHIVEIKAENVKRLRAVRVRPDGALVVIGGRNAQGKSSLLDAIEMALGGGKSIPLEPVRHGARKARIVIDLGDIVVERTFDAKGTAVVVRGKDGQEKASPQRLLDSLCAKVTFDPFAFSRMKAEEQDSLLKKLLGLDFSDIEAARKKLYDQRTETNREIKKLAALLDSFEEHDGAPAEPIDVAEVSAELKRRNTHNADRRVALERVETARRDLADHDKEIERAKSKIRELQEELAEAEAQRMTMLEAIVTSEQKLPAELATVELETKIATAGATNEKVRQNQVRKTQETDLKRLEGEAEEQTDTIESLDEEKAIRLAAAKFPIDGLGFDDSGPTLNKVPLAQASSAQKLRVSVAIGAALNPRVKVMLVREGSLLDDESMGLLDTLARETDSQVWIERVGTKDASAVIIEDGEVASPAAESAAE